MNLKTNAGDWHGPRDTAPGSNWAESRARLGQGPVSPGGVNKHLLHLTCLLLCPWTLLHCSPTGPSYKHRVAKAWPPLGWAAALWARGEQGEARQRIDWHKQARGLGSSQHGRCGRAPGTKQGWKSRQHSTGRQERTSSRCGTAVGHGPDFPVVPTLPGGKAEVATSFLHVYLK